MTAEWSAEALANLRQAEAAVACQSPANAARLVARIFDLADRTAAQPGLGPEVSEYGDPAVREVFEQPYRILYRVDDTGGVRVIGVRHSARRLPRTPPG